MSSENIRDVVKEKYGEAAPGLHLAARERREKHIEAPRRDGGHGPPYLVLMRKAGENVVHPDREFANGAPRLRVGLELLPVEVESPHVMVGKFADVLDFLGRQLAHHLAG